MCKLNKEMRLKYIISYQNKILNEINQLYKYKAMKNIKELNFEEYCEKKTVGGNTIKLIRLNYMTTVSGYTKIQLATRG